MTVVGAHEANLAEVYAQAERVAESGPEWLRGLRRRALAGHVAAGIPTMKNEEWKYTSLRAVVETEWRPAQPGPACFEAGLPRLAQDSVQIVLVNGQLDRNLSDQANEHGVEVGSLWDAVVERDGLAQAHLEQATNFAAHSFAALNAALFTDGVFLRVAAGVHASKPIEIVHVTSGVGHVLAPRLLIVVEADAKAQVVEHYISDGQAENLTLPVTEVFVGRGADVEHVRVQDESASGHHIALWEVKQEQGSAYRSYNIAFGGALARVDQNIWIGGRHTTTRLDGVVLSRGDQVIDNHTRLDHAMPDGTSFEIYKQIVDDRATVVFNGKIFVHQDAQKTDAKQTNQALLLSPQATVDSKPQLEIFADDVKCTHGATVGQLEEAPLFYMRSRGLPRKQAEAVLVYAFAAEVLELITLADVRGALEETLFARLAQGRTELGERE